MERDKIIFLGVSLLLMLIFLYQLIDYYALLNEYNVLVIHYNNYIKKSSLEKCDIYYAYRDIYLKQDKANGLYWRGKDFYCVWANERNITEVEATDRHEYCHYLVDNDYEHFCGNRE